MEALEGANSYNWNDDDVMAYRRPIGMGKGGGQVSPWRGALVSRKAVLVSCLELPFGRYLGVQMLQM